MADLSLRRVIRIGLKYSIVMTISVMLMLWPISYSRILSYEFETDSSWSILYLEAGNLKLWLKQWPDADADAVELPNGPLVSFCGSVSRKFSVPLPVMIGAIFLLGLPLWLIRPPIPPSLCRSCGYDLTGNLSGRCSECGREIEGEEIVRPPDGKKDESSGTRD